MLPGGGYGRHAAHEAEPVAEWLNGLGLHAFVLRYPVAPARHPAALLAAYSALSWIRGGEHGLAVDADRVAVIGFSAGGHVAASVAAGADAQGAVPTRAERPDRCILAYPVVSFREEPHEGSVLNLLGAAPTPEERRAVSAEESVGPDHPPTFIWHTAGDASVPASHSLRYVGALHSAGVPVDFHLFQDGEHGLGLANDGRASSAAEWPRLCERWLTAAGWTQPE